MIKRTYLVIVILIVFLVIGNIIYYKYNQYSEYNKYKIENIEQNIKTWFISFGGPGQNYLDAVERITRDYGKLEVEGKKVFDNVIKYTDADLKSDPEFWEKNGQMAENTVGNFFGGYGHWIWKPYVILKTLDQMEENDILLYLDAGCDIREEKGTEDNGEDMMKLIENCQMYDMLYTSCGSDRFVRMYTKMDLLIYMNMDTEEVMNSPQNQAGILFIKKNSHTYKFVKEWYELACIHHLLDDSNSVVSNTNTDYEDTRNDQSIFNLLTIKYGYSQKNIMHEFPPIVVARRRGG